MSQSTPPMMKMESKAYFAFWLMLSTSAKQAGLPRPALGGVGAASAKLHLFYT